MSLEKKGSLVLAGSGIKFLSHLTHETHVHLSAADSVLFLSSDVVFDEWISKQCLCAKSLSFLYYKYEMRVDCYKAVSNYVIEQVRSGKNVCFIIYGHPSVFSQPGLKAVSALKKLNFPAKILPAISAEDCLFADLLIDPGSVGCLSYEATDLVVFNRPLIPYSHLIIWQVSTIGILNHKMEQVKSSNINILIDKLKSVYPDNHVVTIYVAAIYPGFEPVIFSSTISALVNVEIPRFATLYIPPSIDLEFDKGIMDRLGLSSIINA